MKIKIYSHNMLRTIFLQIRKIINEQTLTGCMCSLLSGPYRSSSLPALLSCFCVWASADQADNQHFLPNISEFAKFTALLRQE